MNFFSPAEVASNYLAVGKGKAERAASQLFAMSMLAGILIAFSAVASATASHTVENVGIARLVAGATFAFGLPMVIITGAELFTGNNLISIALLHKQTTMGRMLRSWAIVYLGNFIGALAVAALCSYSGQYNYSAGGLAVSVMKTAAAKCALPFGNAVILGFMCNVLVCLGVIMALSGKDNISRIAGAFMPVFFFVISGFEHSIANMYYIPAGLFAAMNPEYASLASQAGVAMDGLSWGSFLLKNLLPVTLGNVIGGVSVGYIMWYCFLKGTEKA